jgi:hypothetical protein
LLPALHAREARDGCLRVVKNYRDVGAQLAEYWSYDSLGLLEHGDQQVFRFDLLVLISFGQLDGRLDCFLSAEREFV